MRQLVTTHSTASALLLPFRPSQANLRRACSTEYCGATAAGDQLWPWGFLGPEERRCSWNIQSSYQMLMCLQMLLLISVRQLRSHTSYTGFETACSWTLPDDESCEKDLD
jgi:hypothetical protein